MTSKDLGRWRDDPFGFSVSDGYGTTLQVYVPRWSDHLCVSVETGPRVQSIILTREQVMVLRGALDHLMDKMEVEG